MVMSVNTNITSLNAQQNLAKSQSKLATAISRLSSGMRINSAKDDAAGLAIATRFSTQINGLNQAVSNANDGISLAQTTESALNEVTNNMQRIRTLAVQSANATNSDSDRSALDAEVQQRLSEITRISQQTTFNGRHVLDGTFGSAAFQIGANVGETISVNLSQGAGASQVGQMATSATGDISSLFTSGASSATAASVDSAATISSFNFANTAATSSVATATGVAGFDYSTTNKSFTINGTAVALTKAEGSQAALVTDVQTQLDAGAGGAGAYTVAASGTNGFTITSTATGAASAITVGGTDASFITGNTTGTDAVTNAKSFSIDGHAISLTTNDTNMAGLISDIQTQLGTSASSYALSNDAGKLKIATVATGSSAAIAITGTDSSFFGTPVAGAAAVTGSASNLVLASGDLTINGTDMAGSYKDAQSLVDAVNSKGITGVSGYYDSTTKEVHLNSQAALTVGGTKSGSGTGDLGFSGAGSAIATGGALASSNVKTVSGANDTISRIDAALSTVSSMRSDLGAVQNRFDSTIANLQTISQNLSSSRSQIQDADFAAETANMSSANILQQAGVSVLAQANSMTQSVLKLLQ